MRETVSRPRCGANEQFGMAVQPGMIQTEMIGNKVEDQLQSILMQPFTEAGQTGLPSKLLWHVVPRDRIRRGSDIRIGPTRQHLIIDTALIGVIDCL